MKKSNKTAELADRVVDFMYATSVMLIHLQKRSSTSLDKRVRIDMELRRRANDSKRAERAGLGTCAWGTGDVRNLFEELRDRGVEPAASKTAIGAN